MKYYRERTILLIMRLTIPLILLLLSGVSQGIEVELSKKVLKLGEALEVKVRGIEKSGNYICWLNDSPYPLYWFNANTLRTFIGFGAKFKAKTCSLKIEEEGQSVRKDQVIARVGATGRVTASHLHFGLYIHGTPIDPL